jgi:hypothetical protein
MFMDLFHNPALKGRGFSRLAGCGKFAALKGHDRGTLWGACRNGTSKIASFAGCEKILSKGQEASGHDFSRAESRFKSTGALAPEVRFSGDSFFFPQPV